MLKNEILTVYQEIKHPYTKLNLSYHLFKIGASMALVLFVFNFFSLFSCSCFIFAFVLVFLTHSINLYLLFLFEKIKIDKEIIITKKNCPAVISFSAIKYIRNSKYRITKSIFLIIFFILYPSILRDIHQQVHRVLGNHS